MWSFLPRLRRRDDRADPDFLVLGAQKCGTTSLYAWISEHPQVTPAKTKEVHYFDRWFERGEAWYRGHFPRRRRLRRARAITGEATPAYLFHPECPDRVRRHVPGAKLLVLLRDPVKRAWSNYHHAVRTGRERGAFEDAVDRELRLLEDPAAAAAARRPSYLRRGFYAEQLRRWHARFPEDQLACFLSEDLFRDPNVVLDEVTRFLGLAAHDWRWLREARARNQHPHPPMEPATRDRLREIFRRPNQELAELLGRDPGWDA